MFLWQILSFNNTFDAFYWNYLLSVLSVSVCTHGQLNSQSNTHRTTCSCRWSGRGCILGGQLAAVGGTTALCPTLLERPRQLWPHLHHRYCTTHWPDNFPPQLPNTTQTRIMIVTEEWFIFGSCFICVPNTCTISTGLIHVFAVSSFFFLTPEEMFVRVEIHFSIE